MHIVTISHKDGKTEKKEFRSKYNAETLVNNVQDDMSYFKDRSKIKGVSLETISDKLAA